MMTGKVYIDGVDIYAEYGMILLDDGFSDLFLFPPMKQPDYNDWPEEDGIEVDLSSPKIENKTVNVSFGCAAYDNVRIDNFLSFITQPGYRLFEIKDLKRKWSLRVVSESDRKVFINGQVFTIQFADDFPLELINDYSFIATETQDMIITENEECFIIASFGVRPPYGFGYPLPKSKYKIDNVGLEQYGIFVEKGKSSVYSIPKIKQALTRSSQYLDGVDYDAGLVKFEAKDVTLECAFYSDSITGFWSNYQAFFNDLIKPGQRQLYVDYTKEYFSCYYKNTSSFKFAVKNETILCKFNLTLVFTDFRPKTI